MSYFLSAIFILESIKISKLIFLLIQINKIVPIQTLDENVICTGFIKVLKEEEFKKVFFSTLASVNQQFIWKYNI